MELAYSGLHQLCLPLLGDLDRLPIRSVTPSPRSLASVRALHRMGSWSAWRCSP